MKKNFVKKLALGLALVMAVTSVPVSSEAAAKPFFKNASVEVKEGETVKAVIKKTKGYTVKKVASKNEEVAKVLKFAQKAKKTNVKVEGVKAGEATVVATLKKGDNKVKAKLAVTVVSKEASLVSVEATGAKKLTLTLSAAADVKAADLTIKKGNVAPNVAEVAVDGKTVVVTLGSKMTKGTYEVTYKNVTKAIDVEDETLTTLSVIGTNLVETVGIDVNASPAVTEATATISYQTLNQYGERMAAPGTVVPSSSFSATAPSITKVATAKRDGVITITNIPQTLAIVGQAGTVVLVDNKVGVNSSTTVTYSAPATLSSVEVVGMYDMDELEYSSVVEGDDIADFVLVIKGFDQYGVEMDKDRIIADAGNLALTATPILSNVTIAGTTVNATNLIEVEIDGTAYPAFRLSGGTKATAGSLNLILVNTKKGTLISETFEIAKTIIVKSMSITPSDTVYALAYTKMDYEIIDQNGNEVTSYKALKNILAPLDPNFDLSKNQDGTATLYYVGSSTGYAGSKDTFRMSKPVTETVYAHMGTANMVVTTVSLNVFTEKVPQEVTSYKGLNACASTSGAIKFTAADIVVEDQYGNALVPDVDYCLSKHLNEVNYRIVEDDGVDSFTEAQGTVDTLWSALDQAFVINSAGTNKGTATIYFDVKDDLSTLATAQLVEEKADTEVEIATVDASKATGLSIEKVNKNWVVNERSASAAYVPYTTLSESDIVVYGRVGNYTIEIPTMMYNITGDTFKGFDKAAIDAKNGLSKETVEVSVYTEDETVVLTSEYTRSNMEPQLAVLAFAATTSTTPDTTIDRTDLDALLYVKDQYGVNFSLADVKYDVTIKSALNGTVDYADDIVVAKNQTGNVTLTGLQSGSNVTLYVTVTLEGQTVTKLVTFTVS